MGGGGRCWRSEYFLTLVVSVLHAHTQTVNHSDKNIKIFICGTHFNLTQHDYNRNNRRSHTHINILLLCFLYCFVKFTFTTYNNHNNNNNKEDF